MPALDLSVIDRLGRDLHPTHPGLLSEDEVCPWTLFLTMALTLLKGVMPHVPRMLPVLVSDPEARLRAQETFESEEFKNNIEKYFVENIKEDIQAPLNRQILRSSETVLYSVDLMNNLINTFIGAPVNDFEDGSNDLGKNVDHPRSGGILSPSTLSQLFQFGQTLYNLAK